MLRKGGRFGLTSISDKGFTIRMGCLLKTFNLNRSYSFLTTNSLFPACTLEGEHCQKILGLTTETNRCIEVGKTLLIAAFPIGIIAVLLNVVVAVITLSSKLLRQHPYLILVSLLALGDTLTGIYMMAVASVYQAMSLVEIETKRKDFCDYISFLLTFGNLISMDASLFLTIERYLATVFCLKPNLRMKMKHVLLAPFLAITAGLALSVWGLLDENLYVGGFAGYVCYPIPDLKHQQYRVYAIIVITCANLAYLSIMGMYLHIFIAARNSSKQVGIAREAKLAKRIGAVVFTNFVCTFLPFAFFFVVIATGSFAGSSAEVSVGIVVGCLVILPGINSIMNPILYGYKNEKFQRSFQGRIHCLTERVNASRQGRSFKSSPAELINARQGRTQPIPPVLLLRYVTTSTSGMASGPNRSSQRNHAANINIQTSIL